MHRNVPGSAAAISGIGVAGGVFVWLGLAELADAQCVYSIICRDRGSREDFVGACVLALQLATSTGTSLRPWASTDAEMLLAGRTDDLAQAVVR